MKKLLIMLMVVAMASFLFVGCLGDGVTPPVDDEDEDEDGVTPPTTVPPIITGIADIVGGYVNAVRALDGIVVNGTAPTYSEVKVYINGITAGTGDAGANGVFQVVVANADLIKAAKVDGTKTLYATATDLGLPESVSSNVRTFILDTAYPKIKSVKARAGAAAVPASATEVVIGGVGGVSALSVVPFVETPPSVETGTWTINVNAASGTNNVSITDPNGIITWYTSGAADNFAENAPIPGVSFTLANPLLPVQLSQIVCVAATAALRGVVSLTYDEDLSWTGAVTNGVYTIWNNATAADILVVPPQSTVFWTFNEASDTMFWRETVAGAATDLRQGDFLTFQVDSATDLAGNPIPLATPETATTVVLASTIAIAP